jgi:hypothetical protein
MIEIINTEVAFLEKSIISSGLPMNLGKPTRTKILPNDLKRAKKLGNVKSGTGHDSFLKGIAVNFDLRYPEFFSPQLQRYHWVDIVSSQSKMHKLMSKPLTKEDFSGEVLSTTLLMLNKYIAERDFNRLLANLPAGYMKWMNVSTNYLQLKTIYFQRKNHKLIEWRQFCEWIETLPMFKEIVL